MSDCSIAADMLDGPQGSAWRTTAPPAMGAVENATTAVTRALAYSLYLSLFPPPSPFFSPALSSTVLGSRSRAESMSAGKKGKEGQGRGSSHIYEGGKGVKWLGDETRKENFSRSGAVNADPIKPPTRPPFSH